MYYTIGIHVISSLMTSNYLGVCTQCGRLVVIQADRESPEHQFGTDKSQNSALRSFPISLSLAKEYHHHLPLFDAVFPVCRLCFLRSTNTLEMTIENVKRATQKYRSVSEIPASVLKGEIERRVTKPTEVVTPVRTKEAQVSRKAEEEPNAKKQVELLISNTPLPRMKLGIVAAFRLWYHRQSGTINGIRARQASGESVRECNVALQMIVHMVWAMHRSFGVAPLFDIFPVGEIAIEGKRFAIQLTEGFDRRSVAVFNKALDAFFQTCGALFTSEDVMKYCGTPPGLIDAERKMIGSFSYRFDVNRLGLWSMALRSLLFDLKIIQARSFDRFLELR